MLHTAAAPEPTPPPQVAQGLQAARTGVELAQAAQRLASADGAREALDASAAGVGSAAALLSARESERAARALELAQRAGDLAGSAASGSPRRVASDAAAVARAAAPESADAAMIARYANTLVDAAAGVASASSSPPPLPEVAMALRIGDDEGAWRVQRVRVDEGISRLWEGSVQVVAEGADASPDALLGAEVTVELKRAPLVRRFVGIVRRVEDVGVASGQRVARVTVVPSLWRLSQARDARIFQDCTALDVIREVLRGRGLYDGRLDVELEAEHLRREYVVQYHESDLDFLARLLAEEGIVWYFRHEEGGERLVVTDHLRGHQPIETLDGGAVPVAGAEAATLQTESVRFFDWSRELRPTAATLRDFDWTRPDMSLTASSGAAQATDLPVYEYPAETVITAYSDPSYQRDARDAWARTRQQRHEATARTARAHGNVTCMAPGATFTLTGHLRHELDVAWLIVGVEHEAEARELTHHEAGREQAGGERYRNRLLCVTAQTPWQSDAAPPRPRIDGLQTATVTGPDGEEIYTDEHGRIKVRFHWDRAGRRGEQTTCWMRVLQPWSGAGWGFVFIPRVGMEVVVSFLEGNPDRPIVLGCAYNGTHRPPYTLPDEKTKSTIKTSSSPGGGGYNELRFEDAAGSEEVFVHAQKDFNEVVEHDHSTLVHNDQRNTVDRNHTESVGGSQSLSVSGSRSKTVDHDETTTVHQSRTETVDGRETITIGGARTETVTGREAITLRDVRETTVAKGDKLTVSTGERRVDVNAGDDVHNVTGNKTDHVTRAWDITADQRWKAVQGDVTLRLESEADLQAGGRKITLQNASASAVFDGNKLRLTAVSEMSLVCGNASITLKADGTVTVMGTQKAVLSSTGSAVTAEPAGVTTNGPKITSAATGTHEITGALVKIN